MNAKRKMIISITAFAMVILAAVVAVVAVLAARNVTVQSSINVSYTADKVKCTVTAKYVLGKDGDEVEFINDSFNGTETGTDATKDFTEEMPEIELTVDKDYVDFIYTFTNDNSDSTDEFTVTLQALPTAPENSTLTIESGSPTGFSSSNLSFTVAGGTTETCIFRFSITDKDFDVESTDFNFNWTIGY